MKEEAKATLNNKSLSSPFFFTQRVKDVPYEITKKE